MTKIIAIVNHKGGVGKTTTTLNLGKALSMQGKKLLLIDIDPQANLTTSLGLRDTEGDISQCLLEKNDLFIHQFDSVFHLVPSSLRLARAETELTMKPGGANRLKLALQKIQNNYDYILIDCPPSLGILTVNALVAATNFMVVVQAQYLAVDGLTTILSVIEELEEDLELKLKISGILMTQVKNTNISKESVNFVQTNYPTQIFKTMIRENTALADSTALGEDIFTHNPKCNGAEDYLKLSKELLKNG